MGETFKGAQLPEGVRGRAKTGTHLPPVPNRDLNHINPTTGDAAFHNPRQLTQGLGRGPQHREPPRSLHQPHPALSRRISHPQPDPSPSSLHPSLPRQPPFAPTEHQGKLNPNANLPAEHRSRTHAGPSHQERVKGGLAAGTRGMITGWKYLEGVNGKKGEG